MHQQLITNCDCEAQVFPPDIEQKILCRLNGRVRDLKLMACDDGLVLQGRALTYHAKQLAQHAVMELTKLPIRANEIEVSQMQMRCLTC